MTTTMMMSKNMLLRRTIPAAIRRRGGGGGGGRRNVVSSGATAAAAAASSAAVAAMALVASSSLYLREDDNDDDEYYRNNRKEDEEDHSNNFLSSFSHHHGPAGRRIGSGHVGNLDYNIDETRRRRAVVTRFLQQQAATTKTTTTTFCEAGGAFASWGFPSALQRSNTASMLEDTRNKRDELESRYDVNWSNPLGEGAFGSVYKGTNRYNTNEKVAIKKIPKSIVENPIFQKEMDALLLLRKHGGHPNICSMIENYETSNDYLIVLDYIGGKELFDQLCESGSYSEAEAARHIREITSALAFLHGIGIVHADIKPENLMLSDVDINNSVLKVVDLGNAHIIHSEEDLEEDDNDQSSSSSSLSSQQRRQHNNIIDRQKVAAKSPSYCPPEVLHELMDTDDGYASIEPSFDMWSLGIVIYIMLVGMHPFDPRANASPDEIESRILSGRKPPLRNSKYTRHLSKDAIDLIEGLMEWDPSKRLTADEVLSNPWVQGQTALHKKIADSDKRLSQYRKYKTKIGSTFFKAFLTSRDTIQPPRMKASSKRTKSNNKGGQTSVVAEESMLQTAFRQLDYNEQGYLSAHEILSTPSSSHNTEDDPSFAVDGGYEDQRNSKVSYSEVSLLLAETMTNRYYPKGHTLYRKGDKANSLYLVDSGTIQLTSQEQDGLVIEKKLKSGDLIGVTAMMNQVSPNKTDGSAGDGGGRYSQTAKCVTPVHVLEIPKDVFEKYMKADKETALNMEETKRHIRRERANAILRSNTACYERSYRRGQTIFKAGSKWRDPDLIFIDQGEVDLVVPGSISVRQVQPGEIMGEHAAYFGKRYNCTSRCASDVCKIVHLPSSAMHRALANNEALKQDFYDLLLRRDFKKAVCHATKRAFPTTIEEIRNTFEELDKQHTEELKLDKIRDIVHRFDKSYKEEDIRQMLSSMDLNGSQSITYDEFKRIFLMDKEA